MAAPPVRLALLMLLGLHPEASKRFETPKEAIKQCILPSKFEGKAQVVINVNLTGPYSPVQAFGNSSMHVDITKDRAALHVKVYFGSKERERSIIIAGNNRHTSSSFGDRLCSTDPLSDVLTNSSMYIRADRLRGVPVQVWRILYQDSRGKGYVQVYLTQDTCLPLLLQAEVRGGYKKVMSITDPYFDYTKGMPATADDESVVVTHTFYDMRKGVKDVSALTPPDYCQGNHTSKRYIYGHLHQADLSDTQRWFRELVLLSAMADIDYRL